MATYPCSVGMHRYGGAQRSSYLSKIQGRDPETRKMRLCKRHFDEIQQRAATALTFLDEDDDSLQMSLICEQCGQAGRELTISMKLYPGGEDALQYVGDFCLSCASDVLGILGWDGAQAM